MRKTSSPLLFLTLLTFFLSGCASVSTNQTARVLKEGKARAHIGGAWAKMPSTTSASGEIGFIVLEGGLRLGIHEDFELGTQWILPGTFGADLKYELASDDQMAVSIGFGGRYVAVSASDSSIFDDRFQTRILDLFVPAYMSYDFNEWSGFYLSSKYIFRHSKGTASGALSHSDSFLGTTLGLRLGSRVGVYVEGTYVMGLKGSQNMTQVGVSLFFGDPHIEVESPPKERSEEERS